MSTNLKSFSDKTDLSGSKLGDLSVCRKKFINRIPVTSPVSRPATAKNNKKPFGLTKPSTYKDLAICSSAYHRLCRSCQTDAGQTFYGLLRKTIFYTCQTRAIILPWT